VVFVPGPPSPLDPQTSCPFLGEIATIIINNDIIPFPNPLTNYYIKLNN
jgi:hypothetical protein